MQNSASGKNAVMEVEDCGMPENTDKHVQTKIPTAETIKELCRVLGADMAGIASPEAFVGAPKGFHPRDVLPDCAAVIVVACTFPADATDADFQTYTKARNELVAKTNSLSRAIVKHLKQAGFSAKSIASVGTVSAGGRFRGPISLKHAAELAGLGRIGKNTLLVNESHGNMLWLGAALTSAKLEPDAATDYETCGEKCSLCIDSCPVSALSAPLFNQRTCFAHSYKTINKALEIQCWKCRKICPLRRGITQAKHPKRQHGRTRPLSDN